MFHERRKAKVGCCVELTDDAPKMAVAPLKESRAVDQRDGAGDKSLEARFQFGPRNRNYLWLVVVVVSEDSVLVTAAGATVRLTTTLLTTC